MCQITIDVPDAVVMDLHLDSSAGSSEVKIAAAMGLYAAGRLAHLQACQFAGLDRISFAERLRSAHIPEHYRTVDDFAVEFAGA